MFATTRAELAAALTQVTGVTGYATRPTVVSENDAWPQLANVTRDGQAWAVVWRIFVVLPSDERAAITRTDELFHELTDELGPWLYVDEVTPVLLTLEGGDRPALQITGRSE